MKLMELALKIRDFCGIDFTHNLSNLDVKVSKRLSETELSLEEYIVYLQKDQKEWDKLVEQITINETYFFREFNQLEEFQNLVRKNPGKQINVWCIPCSTGEEAYSLAIMAKEVELFTGTKVRIIASDLNKKVMDLAKKGFYPKNSLAFRRLPENREYVKRYFIEKENGYEIKNEIREMVHFIPFNLTDYHSYSKFKDMDFIFCRNVLFYFNGEIIREIISSFYSILKNDGYLFLGHAESISSYQSNFVNVHTKDAFYYKKEEDKIEEIQSKKVFLPF